MKKTLIEIRAASGGEESKLLVLEQFGIYYKYCKLKGYWLTLVEESPGFVSFIIEANKFVLEGEAGGHQFMRVSPTDKKGRVHTSLITVAVLPIKPLKQIALQESDCSFRFIKASSKGGQHANKTNSGVVLKHLPTGLEIKSTSDRSQHVNKEIALEILSTKLSSLASNNYNSKLEYQRSNQIGSGHRSDKIRTVRVVDNIVKCELTNKTISFKEYYKGFIEF